MKEPQDKSDSVPDSRVKLDLIKWELANPWLVGGQPDDRPPMNGAVPNGGGTRAEQASLARRTHQANFKKWSQERHD